MVEFPFKGLVYEEMPPSNDFNSRRILKQCTLFTDEETKEISNAAFVMEKLFKNIERSIAAEKAYNEFKDELRNLKSGDKYAIAEVDRRFCAYVMEFRLFLEHWKKYISDLKKINKHYGSIYEKLYSDVTHEAYDTCEEYVLAYCLRNYVVHAYDSIDSCYIDGYRNEVYISKKNILKINMPKNARLVIQKQPELINLSVVAEKSLASLQKVQENLINYQINEDVVQAVLVLLNAKKRIDEAGFQSNFWMLIEDHKPQMVLDYKSGIEVCRVKDEKGNAVQEESKILPRMVSGVEIIPQFLNWTAYTAIAGYVKRLLEQGYWQEIQEKFEM